ncbi:MAG TPA: hypothetical protein VLA68_02615, partial [Nitrososphaera sp.]|nr:hypothetical protein [Nitrososphaera sp.]
VPQNVKLHGATSPLEYINLPATSVPSCFNYVKWDHGKIVIVLAQRAYDLAIHFQNRRTPKA